MVGNRLMMNPEEFSQLQNLLVSDDGQDQSLNLAELQGFLFGLAITPEQIQPQEWLPLVLGDRQAGSILPQQEKLLLEILVETYNRYSGQHRERLLQFPYCLKLPSEETVSDALDWAFGFSLALEMRPEIWFGNEPMGGTAEGINENLIASFSVVRGIAWPDEAEELFAGEEGPDQLRDECDLLAALLVALPEAVSVILEYAARLEARPTRIGRNEPCPCGSGMKFQGCCSDHRTTQH
jgi:uncharacterized protein